MRKILVLEQFMDEHHRAAIRAAAEKAGFAVDFSTADALTAAQAAEYEIVYGLPRPAQLKDMTALRWFCASFAGVDNYVDEGLYAHPGVLLTNSAGAYGVTIAEHVMMVTLMLLRQYPLYAQSMARRQWHAPVPMGSIYGSRVTVLGTGDIGSNVARRFRAMGAAHLCGVRRSGKPAPDFDETLPFTALDDVLPRTDILVMALPGTAETASYNRVYNPCSNPADKPGYNPVSVPERCGKNEADEADNGTDARVTIWEAHPFDDRIDFSAFAPGEVIDIFDGKLIVRTVDGSMRIDRFECSRGIVPGDILY